MPLAGSVTVGVARSGRTPCGPRGRSGVSIGEALTRARTQAGLTVTQVSDQTRIRETVITGIEGDDFSACGGERFFRGDIPPTRQAGRGGLAPLMPDYGAAQH